MAEEYPFKFLKIIGVSGPRKSGKREFSEYLTRELNCQVESINYNDFRKENEEDTEKLFIASLKEMETHLIGPQEKDMKFGGVLQVRGREVQKNIFVVVRGIHLYSSVEMCRIMHRCYLVEPNITKYRQMFCSGEEPIMSEEDFDIQCLVYRRGLKVEVKSLAETDKKVQKLFENKKPILSYFFPVGVVWIGIGGASNSGKTTLSKLLIERLGGSCPLDVIGLDAFFLPNYELPKHKKYGRNWEVPESLDFKSLGEQLQKINSKLERQHYIVSVKNEKRRIDIPLYRVFDPYRRLYYVIVEGFLLFCKPEICKRFDITFWLDADQETCRERRMKRDRISKEWFDDMVWFHYKKFEEVQIKNAEPIVLDAKKKKDVLLEECYQILQKEVDKIKKYKIRT